MAVILRERHDDGNPTYGHSMIATRAKWPSRFRDAGAVGQSDRGAGMGGRSSATPGPPRRHHHQATRPIATRSRGWGLCLHADGHETRVFAEARWAARRARRADERRSPAALPWWAPLRGSGGGSYVGRGFHMIRRPTPRRNTSSGRRSSALSPWVSPRGPLNAKTPAFIRGFAVPPRGFEPRFPP